MHITGERLKYLISLQRHKVKENIKNWGTETDRDGEDILVCLEEFQSLRKIDIVYTIKYAEEAG